MSTPPLPTSLTSNALRAWVVLITLTVLSLAVSAFLDSGRTASLGAAGTGAVLLMTAFKARQVLWHFLDLRRSTLGWRLGLGAYLVVLGLIVLGAFIAAEILHA